MQAVAAFVQTQYREANGVRMQTAQPGVGVRWRSNVAHSGTGRFTLLHADGERGGYGDGREVMTAWLLGNAPCSNDGPLASRICVRGAASDTLYAMHPWVGGDFNPFEELDVCPWSSTSTPMCPCDCQPKWACNLDSARTGSAVEFPTTPAACSRQATNSVPLFGARDDSDVCSMARYLSARARAQCTHSQGLLGGVADAQTYDSDALNDFLHSPSGRGVSQALLYDESMLSGHSVLWSGGTLFDADPYKMSGFLNIPRCDLAPAHVAFGFGSNGATLVVRALSLLREGYARVPSTASPSWVQTLGARWKADVAAAELLYPQLRGAHPPPSDWSCPFRAVAFVGGANASFAPLTPNPVEASLLYGRGGAHPFLAPSSAFALLDSYETTTGACFYPLGGSGTLRYPVQVSQKLHTTVTQLHTTVTQLPPPQAPHLHVSRAERRARAASRASSRPSQWDGGRSPRWRPTSARGVWTSSTRPTREASCAAESRCPRARIRRPPAACSRAFAPSSPAPTAARAPCAKCRGSPRRTRFATALQNAAHSLCH